jgi:iron complex transport system substrate-binding protein
MPFMFSVRRAVVLPLVVAGVFVALAACGRDESVPAARATAASSAVALRDDFGDTVTVTQPFTRIVSLNPTTTEALFAMGAGARVIGRSHWDQWPEAAQRLPDLGPAIRPNLEIVLGTRPDLVLLYASGDNRPAAARLRATGIATYATRVDAIEQFRRTTRDLGRLTGDTAAARMVIDSVDRALAAVRARTAALAHPKVLLPTWDSPLIVIGGGSHLSELVEIAGGRNVYADEAAPSPQVAFEDVVRRDPDVILAGPEGRERIMASPRWRTLRAVREGRVFAYDTMVVGRPSVTLGRAAENLAALLHPRGH